MTYGSADSAYKVEQKGKNLVVTSPYGKKVLHGEYGFTKYNHYQMQMSVEKFRKLFVKEEFNAKLKEEMPKNSAFNVESTKELLYLANQAYYDSKTKDALFYVNEILRRDQKHERAWIMKGSLMHLMNEKELALKYWNRALKINPTNQQLQKMLSME